MHSFPRPTLIDLHILTSLEVFVFQTLESGSGTMGAKGEILIVGVIS